MFEILFHGTEQYRIFTRMDVFTGKYYGDWILGCHSINFHDQINAESFCRGLLSDHGNMRSIRNYLRMEMVIIDVGSLSDGQVIRRLANMFVDETLCIYKVSQPTYWNFSKKNKASATEDAEEAPGEEKKSVSFKIVDKSSNRLLSKIPLKVVFPDGSEQDLQTDSGGKVDLKQLDFSKCEIKTDILGAKLESTLSLDTFDEFKIDDEIDVQYEGDLGSEPKLARVEEHLVKTGDTLENLAKKAGLSWQELAEFNWGASDPEKINEFLRDQVGCVNKTTDGKNLMFDDNDIPGIIYIPYPVKKSGLFTDTTHNLRVRPMSVVFDFGYLKDENQVKLTFSVKGMHPKDLMVRLYEVASWVDPRKRNKSIKQHAIRWGDKAGYEKTGRYIEVKKDETLKIIAEKHGFSSINFILSHIKNHTLMEIRESAESIKEGDVVYIPQASAIEPIPLGELLPVEPLDEEVPGGKRYQAIWDIEKTGYDPLDIDSWIPTISAPIGPMDDWDEEDVEPKGIYQPQFAVLTPGNKVLGVAPTPLRLVHKARLECQKEATCVNALQVGGKVKKTKEGEEEFLALEEPFAFIDDLSSKDEE